MKAILVITILLILFSCAAGPNLMVKPNTSDGKIAGFWLGLWHGIISPVTFIISLFNKNINIYEIHNNGGWYNFGFLFGVMIIFGSSGGGTCRARRSRRRD